METTATAASDNIVNRHQMFQRNVEKQENKNLTYYSDTSNNKKDDTTEEKLFINLSIAQILANLSQTVIDIINDVTSGKATDARSGLMILFRGDRMIYVGLILLFISFSIYIIDVAS
jgi:hypothetical protein